MRDLRSKPDINKKTATDEKVVKDETKRGEGIVDDGGRIDAADKKIEGKGTDEGIKEVQKSVSKAMDVTKDVHKKLDDEQNNRFGEIKNVEKNFSERSESTRKDMQAIKQELSKMKSKDTGEAKGDMKGAASAAEGDSKFLTDAEKKEKNTRTAGEKEMSGQKNKMKGYKTKRG